tara:strand:- start:69 stop:353 length:285 start_codon:yes stop_codon:yes gene_type:complete
MKTEQILMCVVALVLGMLLANMLKSVCGCKVVEGQPACSPEDSKVASIEDAITLCNEWENCDTRPRSKNVVINKFGFIDRRPCKEILGLDQKYR